MARWSLLRALLALAPALVSNSASAWEYVTTDRGVVVYRKAVEGTDVVAFKGVGYADVPIGKLLAVFKNPDERQHWVDRYGEHQTFDRGADSEKYWIHFKLPWPVSDRDYVLSAEGRADPDKRTYTVNIKSIEHPKKGEDDCCVRAMAYGTFYEFSAMPGENRTKMVVEVHTDPKGSLPTWLVNLIQKSWPSKTLTGLSARAKASPLSALPEYADWHAKPAATAPVAQEAPAAPTQPTGAP